MKAKFEPFQGHELHFVRPEIPQEKESKIAWLVLELLCDGWHGNWRDMINWMTLKAVLLKENPKLVAKAREGFQQGFLYLFEQLQQLQFDENTLLQVDIFINNCLVFLPYFNPRPDEVYRIPYWNGTEWQLADYRPEPIVLTPERKKPHFFNQKHDVFTVYGFKADQLPAPTYLVCYGTPYPAAKGFWVGLKSDFQAYRMVGASLYHSGRARLKAWLEAQDKPVHVTGISLGASIALQLAIDQGQLVRQVHAYNPAGLMRPQAEQDLDHWDGMSNKPYVRVIRQGSDPISTLGYYKSEWDLIYLKPSDADKGKIGILDHALNFAGEPDTVFSTLDADEQNHRYRHRTRFIYGHGRSLLYGVAFLPYHYVARPGIFAVVNTVKAIFCHRQDTDVPATPASTGMPL